jgi:hypothetical protein
VSLVMVIIAFLGGLENQVTRTKSYIRSFALCI